MTEEFKAVAINKSAIVLPRGILKENIAIIDEQEDHVVLTMRAPRDMRPDNAGLLALSRDDDLGAGIGSWLNLRAAWLQSH